MGLDLVHDTQETYRKLVHSMSRPGTISTIEGEVNPQIPCYHATFLTTLTLLDAEVRFHVVSDNRNLGKVIADYTLAKECSIEEADYIFVPNGAKEEVVLEALRKCKVGTLMDPQNSATWIIEQDVLQNSESIVLTGPGVKEEAALQLDVSEEFWIIRNEKVKEFPLGVDLIFTDSVSLVCVPRTTNVSVNGGGM